MFRKTILALAVMVAGPAAHADVINLSAGPVSPNAGPGSYQQYATPNFITKSLAAGSYALSVVGTAGGGAYDAFTIYAPAANNGAYSDGFHYALNGGPDNRVVTGVNYASAAAALSAYEALTPTVFTLATPGTVQLYLNDASYPYFSDDSGGVSVSITAVPEPASFVILAAAIATLLVARHRRLTAIRLPISRRRS